MPRDQKIIRDGFLSQLGGVDSSRSPSLLTPEQAAWAGNVSMRNGFPATRPRFFQEPLAYANSEQALWIETHAVQASTVYVPKYRDAVIIASIGGRIFEIAPLDGFSVKEITPHSITTTAVNFTALAVGVNVPVQVDDPAVIPIGLPIEINGSIYQVVSISGSTLTVTNIDATPGVVSSGATVMALDPNSQSLGRAWMQQAEQFLIIQDGQRRPIIYDGATSTRSNITLQQVPTGRQMAYGKGRLWVAVNKNEFVAGDIVGGELHDPQYQRIDNLLYFKENTFLANGGSFSTPLQAGDITAMIFMVVLDTSTGNGPLLIHTEGGLIFSVDAPEDRDLWATVKNPFKTIVGIGNAAVSETFITATTNSDIFYRAPDGVRSFYLAQREFTNSWGSTPISTEMNRVLPFDDPLLLKYGSMIQFDNRLLFTVQPLPTMENAYHRGLGILDFNPISSMRGKAPPVYNGVWTGFQPVLLFKGKIGGRERAFSWARNQYGLNEFWEFDTVTGFDNSDSRVASFIETRSMFGQGPGASPLTISRIESVEVWVDNIKGEVDFTLYYRPDQHPCWVEWGRAQSVCSDYRTCDSEESVLCTVPVEKRPTFKTRLNFGQPLDEDMDVDDKPARLGYEFQLRLDWTGHARIRKVLMRLKEVDDEQFPVVA